MTIKYSVIIPAYNEQAYLPLTLEHINFVMSRIKEKGELIVVDNNSSDDTAEIAKAKGAEVVFEPINQISRARNAGARVARGDYLLFIDADTQVDYAVIRRALDLLNSNNCCGGGARVALDGELQGLPKFALASWNLISRKLLLAAGCFVFCRKEGFSAVGGFSEKVYASEEIWFSKALRNWGEKKGMDFIIIDEAGVISSRRKLEWYSQKQLVFLTLLLLLFPPLIFFRKCCSHWYQREN